MGELVSRLVALGEVVEELVSRLGKVALIFVATGYGVRLLGEKAGLSNSTVAIAPFATLAVPAILVVFYYMYPEARRAFERVIEREKASDANKRVTEALEKIHTEAPGRDVAEISTEQVAAQVTDTKVSEAHLKRLVEQGKQKLLIDDRSLQEDVRDLIVDYLQPLPRNAKRVLNRLRVSRLIADKRELFTTEPKVTVRQIGKWLVLGERWPQLGRSLAAAPSRMKVLEAQSESSPPSPAPTMPAVEGQPGSSARPLDPFMESVNTLAPFYIGDEDLRTFIKSEPRLGLILQRLVEYGAAQSPDILA